jgi:transcriptional antiterminator RfaH
VWACAQIQPQRDRLAIHCLAEAGYRPYYPRLRVQRIVRRRKVERTPALFPGYAFVVIESEWYGAKWSPGVIGLLMDGIRPARVADAIIDDLRARERAGLVELPEAPRFRRGDLIKVTSGSLEGRLGLFQGMRAQQRVEVLLGALRINLPRSSIEAA